MLRFAFIFAIVFVLTFALMLGVYAQYGQEMLMGRIMPGFGVSLLVAAYVAFRINMILTRRARRHGTQSAGAGAGLLGGILNIGGESASLRARRERVDARKRRLIKAGKLDEEMPPEPPTPGETPTRVARSSSIDERMAARRERVRRAKEQDKSQD